MWVKVDDKMHSHRKTRAVLRSHAGKRRDAAPMGVWLLAASWAADNKTDGWVPEEELDRFDDDWPALMARLFDAGYWWSEKRDGEPGCGFVDWHDYNDPADLASKSGTFGNHVRWHVNEAKVDPDCDHCPKEPEEPEDRGDIAPDIGGRSGGDSHPESGGESRRDIGCDRSTRPEPEPEPDPSPDKPSADKSAAIDIPDRFDEFWDVYGHKVKRADAEKKWVKALKKRGVTADLLIEAARSYVTFEREHNEGGRFIAHPSTWLHQERWADERAARQPQTRVQEHLTLVQQLALEEEAERHEPRQIGGHR